MTEFWKPGEIVAWRGIFNNRVWHVQPTIVVKDSPEETILTLLPGTECIAEESYPKSYPKGKKKRRWSFVDEDWRLEKYIWRTNRLLLIFEPREYYSTILFWNHESHKFLCYYINFQLPFKRNQCALDTLDLELDLIVNPDLTCEWKDVDDYEKAIEHGIMTPQWIQGIEEAKPEIFDRLERRQYPFDGSWLDWKPDPCWSPPTLPENWDKIYRTQSR
jgi:protein associated with RNAse G/E